MYSLKMASIFRHTCIKCCPRIWCRGDKKALELMNYYKPKLSKKFIELTVQSGEMEKMDVRQKCLRCL